MTPSPSVNDKFPNLVGDTQSSYEFDLYDYLGDSWGMIYCHPGDFTPTCTTELGSVSLRLQEFTRRRVKICGFSCNDSISHQNWIEDIKVATGGIVEIPLFCDPFREHAESLGIVDKSNRDDRGLPMTVRSVYILKPDKSIALVIAYPASTGRDMEEALRAIDACQLAEYYDVCTPVNWTKGNAVFLDPSVSNIDIGKKIGRLEYKTLELPSEKGKKLTTNYYRTIQDPTDNPDLKCLSRSQVCQSIDMAPNTCSKSLGINVKFPKIVGSTQFQDGFELFEYFGDSWGLVFSLPVVHSPVFVSEIVELVKRLKSFRKRQIKVCILCGAKAKESMELIKDVESISGRKFKVPVIFDQFGTCNGRDLNVTGSLDGFAVNTRSVYVVKPDKMIHLMMTYPSSVGYSFDEIIRVCDSSQLTAKYSVATPANWRRGQDVIVNFPLSNEQADEKFGKGGYRIVDVPSEKGKQLAKNYLRYTKDPSSVNEDTCSSDTVNSELDQVLASPTVSTEVGVLVSKDFSKEARISGIGKPWKKMEKKWNFSLFNRGKRTNKMQ